MYSYSKLPPISHQAISRVKVRQRVTSNIAPPPLPPITSIILLLQRLNSLSSTMAAPLCFHGLDALADKIRFHQIEHLAGPFNATSSVNLASRRINSSFQSTMGRQYKDCPSHESVDEGRRRSACSVTAVTPAQSTNKSRSSTVSAEVSPVPFNNCILWG
jgi:hypothetical protein